MATTRNRRGHFRPGSRWWFIDESGQFIPADGELAVMEVFSIPDSQSDLQALEDIIVRRAGPWWRREEKKVLKEAFHRKRLEVVQEIVARGWAAFHLAVRLDREMDAGLRVLLEEVVEEGRLRLRRGIRRRREVEELVQQLGALPRSQFVWSMVLMYTLRRICGFCRASGWVPIGHFRIDPKLAEGWERLATFLVASSVSTVFPEVFGGALSIAMGLSDSNRYFDVELAAVNQSAGVLVADLLAFTAGENVRLGDAAPEEAKAIDRLLSSTTV